MLRQERFLLEYGGVQRQASQLWKDAVHVASVMRHV